MITVKVTTATGNHWTTEINGTYQEAKKYYMGKVFNNADETPQGPVIDVEWLDAPRLNEEQALAIKGLLAIVGWIDDADQLIADEYDQCGSGGVLKTVGLTQSLIDKVNLFLPTSDRITVDLFSELAEFLQGRA